MSDNETAAEKAVLALSHNIVELMHALNAHTRSNEHLADTIQDCTREITRSK